MDIVGGVYFPEDCHLTPSRLLSGLVAELEKGGVQFYWGTKAERLISHGNSIEGVSTSAGRLTADEVLIAGGAWSSELATPLGLALPMQAGKGYSLTLQSPRRLPELCSILTEARVAVTPMGSALRFAGTMEITGLDTSISRRRVDGIIKAIPRYLPDFGREDFEGVPVWSGLRPCSPDGLPYVGRFARFANSSVATGHAMMGLILGPITGKLIGEILTDEPPSVPIDLLNPEPVCVGPCTPDSYPHRDNGIGWSCPSPFPSTQSTPSTTGSMDRAGNFGCGAARVRKG